MPREPVVKTTAGAVSGRTEAAVHELLGVPYAEAPIGPLRFAPPQRRARWDGVRAATTHGPTAPQPELPAAGPSVIAPGDDHLHVNVWTPELGAAASLPVFVWIHGGGWVLGSNADPVIDGRRLAARGMVVVSVNYRLGVEGFLALHDAASNRAVLDWLLALEWVQDNIERFGGDPARVTVGGHSAGSAAALILTARPQASHLFHRTLAMSGVPWILPTVAEAAQEADAFVGGLGVDRTVAGVSSVPRERLLEAQNEAAPFGGVRPGLTALEQVHRMVSVPNWLGPAVGDDTIEEHPLDVLLAGGGADRDLMIGSTANELDVLMTMMAPELTSDEVIGALCGVGIRTEAARRWCETGATPAHALGSALTKISFRAPILQIAESRRGGPGRTFLYETTWQPPTPYGAVHSMDVPLAFDNADAPGAALFAGGPPPQTLADDLSGAVARFVMEGDAGWPAYGDDRVSFSVDRPSHADTDPDALVREVFLDRSMPRP